MPPSRAGTIDPLTSKSRVFVDADLDVVEKGSPEAAFIFAPADLDQLKARRQELGLTGDEAERVQRESAKKALADAERRAAAAEAEAAILREQVKADDKAAKSDKTPAAKAEA